MKHHDAERRYLTVVPCETLGRYTVYSVVFLESLTVAASWMRPLPLCMSHGVVLQLDCKKLHQLDISVINAPLPLQEQGDSEKAQLVSDRFYYIPTIAKNRPY